MALAKFFVQIRENYKKVKSCGRKISTYENTPTRPSSLATYPFSLSFPKAVAPSPLKTLLHSHPIPKVLFTSWAQKAGVMKPILSWFSEEDFLHFLPSFFSSSSSSFSAQLRNEISTFLISLIVISFKHANASEITKMRKKCVTQYGKETKEFFCVKKKLTIFFFVRFCKRFSKSKIFQNIFLFCFLKTEWRSTRKS